MIVSAILGYVDSSTRKPIVQAQMSGRDIDEVLRTAGYEDLKKLIDYNDRVQSILVWSKHDPVISTEG